MKDLGNKVSHYRRLKGYTVKELAHCLCDESTLYRLEQGKQVPRLEIINDICLKLEIPFKVLFPMNEEVEKLKSLCRESIYMADYLALELLLERANSMLDKISSIYVKEEFSKFIEWHKAIMLHRRDNKSLDSLHILNSLVNINNCGSELDISIVNSIGLIHLSMKDIYAAHKLYKEIYQQIVNRKIVEDVTIRPRVGYNYAHTLYEIEDFREALVVITETLYHLETHQLMYSLGKTYHLKGLLSEKCGYINEAVEDYQNAILVFTLTKEHENLSRAKDDLADLVGNKK